MTKKLFFTMVLPTLLFVGCHKNDASSSTSSVSSTITNGTWRVTYYSVNGTDKTSTFNNYSFTFVNGGVLTATKNGANVAGTWATGTDNGKVKLILSFLSPPIFINISEDWHVLSNTDTKLSLEHTSGSGSGTDNLTFEKN